MAGCILIVDDEPDIVDLLSYNLTSAGYDCPSAATGEQALEMVARCRPDLLLLDVMLPGIDGIEVCRRVRRDYRFSSTGIIMLTARTGSADVVQGLDAGADDYVIKPFKLDEVLARVRTTLHRSRQLRSTSPLTGLPGNFEISRHVDALIARERRFALLHADLDNFKAFNDRYGFVRGDRAILCTAQVVVAAASAAAATHGSTPFVGHIGGDDFAVVCHPLVAEDVAEAITSGFDAAADALYDPGDRELGVLNLADRAGHVREYPLLSISVGIASTDVRSFSSATEAAAVATEMKCCAKAESGSVWRSDRRSGQSAVPALRAASGRA